MVLTSDLPNEIVIELTEECNLNCSFCFNRQGNHTECGVSSEFGHKAGKTSKTHIKLSAKPSPKLSLSVIKGILNDVKNSGIHAVRLSGGEPLLRKDLKSIVSHAKDLGLYVILNTNLQAKAEHDEIAFFAKNIDLFIVSCHNLSFIENILPRLKMLGGKVMLATIADKNNVFGLEKFYSAIGELLKKGIILEWFLLRPLPNLINPESFKTKDAEQLVSKIRKLNIKHNMNVKIANSIPFCAVSFGCSDVCKGGYSDSGYSRIIINCDGFYRSDYFSGKILGKLPADNIMHVWNSNYMKKLRQYAYVDLYCRECHLLEKCKGGLHNDKMRKPWNVKPLASVIIPTYNNSESLSLVLNSLINQKCRKLGYEIIVVDDGSSDNTKKFVLNYADRKRYIKKDIKCDFPIKNSVKNNTKIFPNIKYLYQKDLGFRAGQARNLGARNAVGKILIFLDDDSVVSDNFITSCMASIKNYDVVIGYNASYGVRASYSVNEIKKHLTSTKNTIHKLKIIPEFRETYFASSENTEKGVSNTNINGVQENKKQQNQNSWRVFAAGNFCIRKELFMDFMFDEDFVGWAEEDVELGYRLAKAGKKIKFDRKCIAYNIRKKASREHPFLTYEKFVTTTMNQILMYAKHMKDKNECASEKNEVNVNDIESYIFDRYKFAPAEFTKKTHLNLKKLEFWYE